MKIEATVSGLRLYSSLSVGQYSRKNHWGLVVFNFFKSLFCHTNILVKWFGIAYHRENSSEDASRQEWAANAARDVTRHFGLIFYWSSQITFLSYLKKSHSVDGFYICRGNNFRSFLCTEIWGSGGDDDDDRMIFFSSFYFHFFSSFNIGFNFLDCLPSEEEEDISSASLPRNRSIERESLSGLYGRIPQKTLMMVARRANFYWINSVYLSVSNTLCVCCSVLSR